MAVIAHRGASARFPEHTWAAYDAAIAGGAAVLELDVRLLADGAPAVVHDATLLRTAGDPRRVAVMRAADLEALPAARKPLLLGEVLGRYGRSIRYLIDLKDPAPPVEETVTALVSSRGLGDLVQIQTFCSRSLRRARRADPAASIAQLHPPGARSRDLVAGLRRVSRYAHAIGPHFGSVDAVLVAAAHHHGLAVQPYTVNAPAEIERLLALGVDGVITDVPDVAARVLRAVRARPALAA